MPEYVKNQHYDFSVADGDDAYLAACAIIQYTDDMNSHWYSQFSYDDFFSNGQYWQTLLHIYCMMVTIATLII